MTSGPEKPRDFTGLYRSTVEPLRRYLTRLLGDHGEAQDIAHDAYLRVYPTIDRQAADNPEALLYTTARRLAFNRLKRRRITPITRDSSPVDLAASTSPGVVQQVMAKQELDALDQAIAQLPRGCRSVLLLRKVDLLSHKEIAERLRISVSTVEKQHARALRLLRGLLSAEAAPLDDAPAQRSPSSSQEARP